MIILIPGVVGTACIGTKPRLAAGSAGLEKCIHPAEAGRLWVLLVPPEVPLEGRRGVWKVVFFGEEAQPWERVGPL
jgi:hypothetical protein